MRRAVSSVFVAIFIIILAFGALFFLIYSMGTQRPGYTQPQPHLSVKYGNGWINVTNEGPAAITIYGFDIFQGANGYLVPYYAYLNPGQEANVFLNASKTAVILTNEGGVVA